jgi:tetratricopeptide (TPR) repeat protein
MKPAVLPNLEALTVMDDRLRQIPRDGAQFARAIASGEQELRVARAVADSSRLRRALIWCGTAHRIAGEHDVAEQQLREALELARDAGDTAQLIGTTIRLAELDRCRDAFPTAETLLRLALRLGEKHKIAVYRDVALQHLGKTLIDAGSAATAIPVLEEALVLRQRNGTPDTVASTEEALRRARQISTIAAGD